jgi:hypothetical protein
MRDVFNAHILILGLILGGMTQDVVWARSDTVPGSRYTAARAAAMGEAYLPLADDGMAALFYNPAQIAGLRKVTFEPFNIQGQFPHGFFETAGLSFYNVLDLNQYKTTLSSYPGKTGGLGWAIAPSVSMPWLSVGLLYEAQTAATVTGANIRVRSSYQIIPAIGVGIPLARGIVKLGYSLQYVMKAVGDQTMTLAAASAWNSGLSQGTGLSHTVGFALTLPVQLNPAINVVARNLFGTTYTAGTLLPLAVNPAGTPPTESMTFDASFSIHPKLGKGSALHIVAQMRDFLNASQTPLLYRLVGGAEWNIRDTFCLRFGYRSYWLSGGFGIRRPKGEIAFTYYSEDMGNGITTDRDLRWLLHFQLRI